MISLRNKKDVNLQFQMVSLSLTTIYCVISKKYQNTSQAMFTISRNTFLSLHQYQNVLTSHKYFICIYLLTWRTTFDRLFMFPNEAKRKFLFTPNRCYLLLKMSNFNVLFIEVIWKKNDCWVRILNWWELFEKRWRD